HALCDDHRYTLRDRFGNSGSDNDRDTVFDIHADAHRHAGRDIHGCGHARCNRDQDAGSGPARHR
ncbi:MAG: hypothetical protein C3F10_04630, partial [Dehalococcoidia bacterium]